MKTFYQFYQQMLRETPMAQPGQPAPAPGQPAAPSKLPAPGQPAAPMAPAQGQGTSPPIPPPDPNLADAMTKLSQVKDPKVAAAFQQFSKQLQGAGVQFPAFTPGSKPGQPQQLPQPTPGQPAAPAQPAMPQPPK